MLATIRQRAARAAVAAARPSVVERVASTQIPLARAFASEAHKHAAAKPAGAPAEKKGNPDAAARFIKAAKMLHMTRIEAAQLTDAQWNEHQAKVKKIKESAGYKAIVSELAETEIGLSVLIDNFYRDPQAREKVEKAMKKFEVKQYVDEAKEVEAGSEGDMRAGFEYPTFTPAGIQYNIFNPEPTFLMTKRMISPFGTIVKPAMIYSPKPYRIVGCAGPYEEPHTVGFFAMEGYLKHACPECGQVFQLTTNPDEVTWDYLPVRSDEDRMKHFL